MRPSVTPRLPWRRIERHVALVIPATAHVRLAAPECNDGAVTPTRIGVLLASGLFALAAVAGCGSSSPSTAVIGTKAQQDCTAVTDLLANGPDPDADPVGYAQAQVLPLQQLKITEVNLRGAVKNLASAYQEFSTSTGSAATSAAVKVSSAETDLNAICPGAAP